MCQSESAACIHAPPFPGFPSRLGPCRALSRFPRALSGLSSAICFIFFFKFYFIIIFFYLWWILSYIEMKQPRVYMCSPSQSPLPPPSPLVPSRFSQCTGSERLSHASNLGWCYLLYKQHQQCTSVRLSLPSRPSLPLWCLCPRLYWMDCSLPSWLLVVSVWLQRRGSVQAPNPVPAVGSLSPKHWTFRGSPTHYSFKVASLHSMPTCYAPLYKPVSSWFRA